MTSGGDFRWLVSPHNIRMPLTTHERLFSTKLSNGIKGLGLGSYFPFRALVSIAYFGRNPALSSRAFLIATSCAR
jgi:hypothetical protein